MTNSTAARLCAAAAILFGASTSAQAITAGFSGAFGDDNDKVVIEFGVGVGGADVELRNWGYGGGSFTADELNGVAGSTTAAIGAGNFDGMLTLFDSAGNVIYSNDNTAYRPSTGGVLTYLSVPTAYSESLGFAYARYQDPEIRQTLDAGVYTLVLSQYYNVSEGGGPQGDYRYDGGTYTNPNYTTQSPRDFNTRCTTGFFCDVVAYDANTGYNRAEEWLVELAGVQYATLIAEDNPTPTTIPVPAAAPLLLGGLAALGAVAANRTRRAR
ncbi:DVUA0089 family protein [Rhodovulum sp. DZ06]|uniref:DVUA0089 family protein n=1 Tax=Rhodovulum sp. DZ06 TaxID=3425126 RepID=UPI003D34FED6